MNIDNKTLRIGYSTVSINKQKPQFSKDNMTDNYGQFLPRENRIEIQPDLVCADEANTLLHEILHSCVWVSSLSQDGQPLHGTKEEELVVNSLANNLTQIFIDNEWLLYYLTENLKRKI
tara:strand:- start:37 stop:393 length:357 start_codon:yes stop_codon:yes gene_type:complete